MWYPESHQPAESREWWAIIRLFLEKLELLTPEERVTISRAIEIASHPVLMVTGNPGAHKEAWPHANE